MRVKQIFRYVSAQNIFLPTYFSEITKLEIIRAKFLKMHQIKITQKGEDCISRKEIIKLLISKNNSKGIYDDEEHLI